MPSDGRVLRLPHDATFDGPTAGIPEGTYDCIFVEGVLEAYGNVEQFVGLLTSRLASGGKLFIDAENEQSPRCLRRTLEGKPNSLDPVGSRVCPEIALSAVRLIDALAAAGLVIDDLYRLPHADRVDPDLVRTLIEHGFMASHYAGETPPARWWGCATARPRVTGSVVIGPGEAARQAATRERLAAILPEDWEVVAHDDACEVVAFNRGVPQTSGETIWFLRAGAVPTATLFEELWQQSVLSPAVPGDHSGPMAPGDFNGLMISRSDLLKVGPIDESWSLEMIAYEDHGMRSDTVGVRMEPAGGLLVTPAVASGEVEAVERESRDLFARWRGVGTEVDPRIARPHPDTASPPWDGRAPKITLCMITRDEERFLDECLRRAAPAVDEIVIVDTGSVDRTIEIAKAHGARVIEEPWSDDFSAPRNSGLEAATGDWVLILDADEALDEGSAREIRRIVEDAHICGYHMRFTNVFDEQKTLGVTMVRLFRKLPGIQWNNRIHEQITPSLLKAAADENMILSTADVHVLHYGYSSELMDSRGKLERNERLFRLQLEEHPEDIYSLYKYGDFLRRVPGRDREAREVLERTLELIVRNHPGTPRGIPYASEVAALCALEYAREENFERAEEILETALRRFMVTPNLHYIAAGVALRRGREDEAIAHYRKCLSYRGQTLVVPIQDGITGPVSLAGIAQALLQKGDRAGARRLLEQAIGIDDSHAVAVMVLSRISLEDGDAQRAIQVLLDFLERYPDSAGVCQQLALLLAQLGHKDQARRMGERAIELLESDASDIEANHMRQTLAKLA